MANEIITDENLIIIQSAIVRQMGFSTDFLSSGIPCNCTLWVVII